MPRRAKSVRRPKPRMAAERTPIRERIRARFGDPFALLDLGLENFHQKLPTPPERHAFAQEFPHEFYCMFEFEASDYDQYPTSVVVASGCCVFRRERFADEFLPTHPSPAPFDPPDLAGVAYRDQQAVMAAARRHWWRANGWPQTAAEVRWQDPREKGQRRISKFALQTGDPND